MRALWYIAFALALQGCGASFNSIYRKDEVAGISVRAVDAKQRLIYMKSDGNGRVIVCPEPSPDALSAGGFAAQLSAEQIKAISGLGVGIASSESAGSLGLRTQTISLLRDQMTQACLSRMSGDLDQQAYLTTLRRLQISALGMLAIEQMTGAVKAAPVVVSVGAQATAGEAQGADGAAPKKKDDAAPDAAGAPKKTPATVVLTASGTHGADAEGQATPKQVENVYQAVLQVLDTVLERGFDFDDCLAAARDLVDGASDSAAIASLQEKCKQTVRTTGGASQTAGRIFTRLSSEEDGAQLTQAKAQVVTRALAAVDPKPVRLGAVATAISALPTSGKTYEGYDIDVFVCDSARSDYAQTLQSYVERNVAPQTSGRARVLRLAPTAFKIRSGGLDPAARPIETVFYDGGDNGREKDIAAKLQAEFKGAAALRLTTMALSPNISPKRTPFYVSAWICPR